MKQISISLKHNDDIERGTEAMLEDILRQFKLDRYIRCNKVVIERGASGQAFPLIRLSARKPGSEGSLLAQFLHEQLHWIEKGQEDQMIQAMEELKPIFPNAPIDKPEGGGSEKSTYVHLIICRLELLALTSMLGKDKALKIVSTNNNYTWIRKMAIDQGSEIDVVTQKYFPLAIEL